MSSLIAEFESLWSSSNKGPDILQWWSSLRDSRTAIPANELLSVLLLDQKHRWQTATPHSVEDYLSRLDALPGGIDARWLSGDVSIS